jgi:hypothetical protein
MLEHSNLPQQGMIMGIEVTCWCTLQLAVPCGNVSSEDNVPTGRLIIQQQSLVDVVSPRPAAALCAEGCRGSRAIPSRGGCQEPAHKASIRTTHPMSSPSVCLSVCLSLISVLGMEPS